MHILFLTDNFPPEVNAPASRTHEHCKEWVARGAQVTVITCAPNFPRGKLYPGYKNRLWQIEHIDGIRVIRVWTYIAENAGFVRRTLDYLSFMLGAAIAGLFPGRVDVVIGTSPQFFTACAALFVAKVRQRPWIFELRDLWPESISSLGAMKQGLALRLLERLEMFLYRQATAVITVTNSFKLNLSGRGIPPRKIGVVTNGVDESLYFPREKSSALISDLHLDAAFVVGYVGTHGMAHGLEALLQAARIVQDRASHPHIHFLLVGDGAEKSALLDVARGLRLDNVTFVDSVTKQEVPHYWSLLDVGVIHLRKKPLFQAVIPSKMFECMAMGIPLLHCVEGESAEIVRLSGAGITLEPDNPEALARNVMALCDCPARLSKFSRAGVIASHQFKRGELAGKMLEMIRAVAERRQSEFAALANSPNDFGNE